eukprot:6519703-Pyramimonas_sp.AAC.1
MDLPTGRACCRDWGHYRATVYSQCVQEEILFVLFPELLVGMLLCQRMNDREAVEIAGAERFNR